MDIKLVDLGRQYQTIKKEIDSSIFNCLSNSSFIGGGEVQNFEKNFAEYCHADFCIPCGNGTDAIEIGLKAIGLKSGDEVIVPANSFIASSEAVTNIGGKVVFCDVDPQTYTINPKLIEKLITPKTRAIIVVHLYGQMADMYPIMEIAKKNNLVLIEDAAQAHGAKYDNKPVGTFGAFTTFSFYPGKNLGAYGDAGAIITNDKSVYEISKKIANHGRINKYDHEMEGRNSRLDAIQAAVLNVKLNYLNDWNEKRRINASLYTEHLKEIKELILPVQHPLSYAVFHLFVIRVTASRRAELANHLKISGIETGVHYPIPLPGLKAYNYLGHHEKEFPVSNAFKDEILSLPMFPELTKEEIIYICNTIRTFFKK